MVINILSNRSEWTFYFLSSVQFNFTIGAINKFNEKYGSKSIKGIELKNKKNKYIYEVEGFDSEKEYKVKIDASSSEILKAKSENLDADDKEDALDLNGLISRSEATKLA